VDWRGIGHCLWCSLLRALEAPARVPDTVLDGIVLSRGSMDGVGEIIAAAILAPAG
jgi:hypothetical protein